MLDVPVRSPGAALRAEWEEGIVIMPGVFNAITARAAFAAGSRALYLTGAGVTNATLAVPDVALVTLTELAQVATNVCQSAPIPVLSDADTGFGETLNVFRTVRELERAGLAGIHLEDQVSPKRCGHLDGKQVIPVKEMAKKVRAAVEARVDPNFVICARTDARGVEGLQAAIDRANCYVDHGADAIFPEGLHDEAEFEAFRKGVSAPLLANMTEYGKTKIISAATFGSIGYQMIIYPMTAFRMMLFAVDRCYRELLSKGTQEHMLSDMKTRAELYDLIEYPEYERRDQAWSDSVEQSFP